MIPLCLSMFDWAHYRRAKGAVKLHMVLDHDGYLPSFAVLTEGKTADITAARQMTFAPRLAFTWTPGALSSAGKSVGENGPNRSIRLVFTWRLSRTHRSPRRERRRPRKLSKECSGRAAAIGGDG